MTAHLSSLQEQVDSLYANLNALRSENGGDTFHPPSEPRSASTSQPPISPGTLYRPPPRHPSFRGPTSSAFSLDVAKNTLHTMGYQGPAEEALSTQNPTPMASPPRQPPPSLVNTSTGEVARDPIWALSKDEMVRLCRVYEEEMGIMYPVVDIEDIIIHGKNIVRIYRP